MRLTADRPTEGRVGGRVETIVSRKKENLQAQSEQVVLQSTNHNTEPVLSSFFWFFLFLSTVKKRDFFLFVSPVE